MEKISKKRLPPLFKISVLWNILPFYGHLHTWKLLLDQLNKETWNIWRKNKDQLIFIGRHYTKEITVDSWEYNNFRDHVLKNKSKCLDLFSLSLYMSSNLFKYGMSFLIINTEENKLIILDSHDDISKAFKIHCCEKDKVSDILPAVNCPSFKPDIKIFKNSEFESLWEFIEENSSKSFILERTNEFISVSSVFSKTVKMIPKMFDNLKQYNVYSQLKERKVLWEITNCVCRQTKVRVLVNSFNILKSTIDRLDWVSYIKDSQFGIQLEGWDMIWEYAWEDYEFELLFNFEFEGVLKRSLKFVFYGEILTVVLKGDTFNFKVDPSIKISGIWEFHGSEVIEHKSKNYFAFIATRAYFLTLILADTEEIDSEKSDLIRYLEGLSADEESCYIVFNKEDITLKSTFGDAKALTKKYNFFSKIDINLSKKLTEKNVYEMLNRIPNHLIIRLILDDIKHVARFMKCKKIIKSMQEHWAKFLYNQIEIEPKRLNNKHDESKFINKVLKKEKRSKD